ncbi:MAG: efflux RND transporter permease subunit [Gemmataceae bacterium]|nr:efflux RND transporter permease subunit [Gemmataceae bacterium]
MFSRFFIDRPIFATVISVVITLAGGVAVWSLPIAQYPEVTPPTVQVTAFYPGANALTVQDTVAAPIEEQISGVEGMTYMSSRCTNDGNYNLTVTFKLGVDTDMAQVLVQNRVSLALPVIPALVQSEGISVKKMSPSTMMIVNLVSPDNSKDATFLSNYATIYIKDELGRMPGVAGITYLGQRDYSLRAWLDPDKLAALKLGAMDVVQAIAQQNVQVAAGQIGQPPVPKGQQFQLTINTKGRLTTPEEFADIIVKSDQSTTTMPAGSDGNAAADASSTAATGTTSTVAASQATAIVRLRHVVTQTPDGKPRVELGSQQYDQSCTLDGAPSVALSIFQLPGSNAIDTARGIYAKMRELKARFPEGVAYKIVYDTTPFIEESVNEVFSTLRDAVVLVAIVVLLFLQDWRAMILPMIDVPVSLIGTFAVMAALGYSLNNLTLFGLVLAIGIVVDDAIVVLENIERLIATGLDARAATIKAMEEITGPVLAITLVLSAVFIPCAFLGGISGQFFRQFAVTIAVSTIISAINALTMTPSRAVLIFKSEKKDGKHEHQKEALPWWFFGLLGGFLTAWLGKRLIAGHFGYPSEPGPHEEPLPAWLSWGVWFAYFTPGAVIGGIIGWIVIRPVNRVLGAFFRAFNRFFDHMTDGYAWTVGKVLTASVVFVLIYVGLLALTAVQFAHAPTGFIPEQDKGYVILNVQLPDSASVERTERMMARIEKIARETPGVKHTVGISGQSLILSANAPNLGSMYVLLDEFEHRRGAGRKADAIAEAIRNRCRKEVRGALASTFGGPPVEGLGTTGGFKLIVEDRGNLGLDQLQQFSDQITEAGNKTEGLAGLYNSSRVRTPWLFLDIDRTKAAALGLTPSDIFNTLQVYLGSFYVNNYNQFGRTWQVNVQADHEYRDEVDKIRQLQVRNKQGQMIRLGTVLDVRDVSGPVMVMRYNMYSATAITGNAAPGTSSGEAIEMMQNLADKTLPPEMATDWTELAYLQLQAGNAAIWVFALAVMFVFLVLAAQYESWSLPLAVILVVPMCLLCSITGVMIANLDVNIFTQIGFVVLVGLASKNAILIVEFAKQREDEGEGVRQATLDASKLRLRPILMTSFAFILGVVPLVIAQGAGAEMRRSLGIAVFAGMVGVTLFGIFLTPVFCYVVRRIAGGSPPRAATPTATAYTPHA